MALWLHRLKITVEWKQAENGELDPQALAAAIVLKLQELGGTANIDDVLQEVVEEFEALAEDQDADFDDFDDVMSRLYDWGDTALRPGVKRCWIATF